MLTRAPADTKSRLSNSIPHEDAQQSARMQVALYKRLLDGLILPYVARSGASVAQPRGEAGEPVLDPFATELAPATLFAALGLDAKARLSSAFVADAEALCESYELQLLREPPSSDPPSLEAEAGSRGDVAGSMPTADARPMSSPPAPRPPSPRQHSPVSDDESRLEAMSRSCTLEDVAQLFAQTIEELLQQAAQGFADADGHSAHAQGAFQAQLELQYRLQASAGRFRKRKMRAPAAPSPARGAPTRQARGGKKRASARMPRRAEEDVKTAAPLEQSTLSFPRALCEASADLEEQALPSSDDADAADLAMALRLSLTGQLQEDGTDTRDEDAQIEADAVPLSTPSQQHAGSQSAHSCATPQSAAHADAASDASTSDKDVAPAASESQPALGALFAPAAARASSQKHVDPTDPSPSSSASVREAAPLIGVVRFTFSALALDAHLRSALALWSGTREPRGVGPGEVYRCRMCEYEEGCEWLSAKAEEAHREYEKRKRARAAPQSAPRDLEDEEALWAATHGLEDSANGAHDPDADLWNRLDAPVEAWDEDW